MNSGYPYFATWPVPHCASFPKAFTPDVRLERAEGLHRQESGDGDRREGQGY